MEEVKVGVRHMEMLHLQNFSRLPTENVGSLRETHLCEWDGTSFPDLLANNRGESHLFGRTPFQLKMLPMCSRNIDLQHKMQF